MGGTVSKPPGGGSGEPRKSTSTPTTPGAELNLEARLQLEIRQLSEKIAARKQDVNVVITGPVLIGTETFCDAFQQHTNGVFKYMDLVTLLESVRNKREDFFENTIKLRQLAVSYDRYVEDMNRQHSEALKQSFTDPTQTQVVHTIDLLRENYLRSFEQGLAELGNYKPQCRIYHRSPIDYLNAFATASLNRGTLSPAAFTALSLISNQSWKFCTNQSDPSTTLFVYIRYPQEVYKTAYDAYLEAKHTAQSNKTQTLKQQQQQQQQQHPEDDIGIAALQAMRRNAEETRALMDHLYVSGKHDATSQYFCIVMDCEDRVLLSSIHSLAICQQVLLFVDLLQSSNIWNASDQVRIQFLSTLRWNISRIRHIPRSLTPTVVQFNSALQMFESRSPQVPRNVVVVDPRIQSLREDDESYTPSKSTPRKQALATTPSLSASSSSSFSTSSSSSLSRKKYVSVNEITASAFVVGGGGNNAMDDDVLQDENF